MDFVRRFFGLASQNHFYTFLYGYVGGAGFELFKIYFSVKGVNYYSVFKRRQLERELTKFESGLRNTEEALVEFYKQKLVTPT